jgi:hypothetical protein
MGVEVIVRDAERLVLAFMYTIVSFITYPTVVEAVAYWKATIFFQRVETPTGNYIEKCIENCVNFATREILLKPIRSINRGSD